MMLVKKRIGFLTFRFSALTTYIGSNIFFFFVKFCSLLYLLKKPSERGSDLTEREKRMGIMDFLNSTTDNLKKKAPNPTPVKDSWWRSSYNYGRTAVNGVRDKGVNKYYPDDETRAKIVRIGTKIGLNAVNYGLEETLKIIPGRKAFDKIVLPAIRDEMALRAIR
ncbi:uncharacterized protein LOC132307730 [Cornus florida]|uniref:uncharacterized protein LOC132307730 n=1 Tax=Cornus florida TaxID=4283 RepID=UPI00289D7759|nr:uncharacterized protein LOC132307730 [Cornus florida]